MYRLLYQTLMVTTMEKAVIDIQNLKGRNINITLKKVIKLQGKRTRKNQRTKQKTTNKTAISKYYQ